MRATWAKVVFAVVVGTAGVAARVAFADEAGITESPFAARSGPRGATLFAPLSAEQTGIVTENRYADPKMWAEHYQELVYGAMGTGVAVGDYDNDGRPDLFAVSKTGQSRLFRNLGNWKFEDATARAGLQREPAAGGASWMKSLMSGLETPSELETWRQGAAFADVDNDGWLDLYVCRFGAPNLLYINQRNGSFKEEAVVRGLGLVDASGMAAFCDFDRDGWLDVYVVTSMLDATAKPAGQRDRLFRNRGQGVFLDVTDEAGISGEAMGHSATWWDCDRDGWPDLYVANDYAAPDRLYRNNRDGTFTDMLDAMLPRTPYYAMGSDLGDVNNDGWIDLMVADMAASTRAKDLRGMAGSRSRAQQVPDVPAGAPQLMHNALYLGTGTDRFQEAARLAGFPATDWTWSVRFEDLDNDGRLDLHVTNGMSREYHNADMLEKLMSIENPAETRRAMQAMPLFAETNLAYRNRGDLDFEEVGAAWGLNQNGVSFGAAFADFDGDGDLDLAFANYEAPLTVLRNDSDRGHRAIVALRGTASNKFGVGATVRVETASGVQVRQLVLARGYLSTSEPVLHFGLGEDTAIRRLSVAWPSGLTQVFENLMPDRRFTITEPAGAGQTETPAAARAGQFTEVAAARGLAFQVAEDFDPRHQPLVITRFDRRGPAVAVGDLNADGRDDVLVGGTGRQAAGAFLGKENFSPIVPVGTAGLDSGPILIFEANGDGRPDVWETRGGVSRPVGSPEYQPALYLGTEAGGWIPASPDTVPPLPISVGAAVAADFDRDGRLDVFLGGRVVPGRYPQAPRSALLLNRGGRFEDATEARAPGLREIGMVTSAVASDVDGDGWVDLVVALEWGGVKCFRNEDGLRFTDISAAAGFAAAGTGWWTALASADFNGDGRPDIVAGNVGLNTPYEASAARPALLFAGRLGGSTPLAVEAAYSGELLQPLLPRNELGSRIPAVSRQFPKNDEYARASLEGILGAERLKAAQRLAATELRSGVFLSGADGKHHFVALPRIAQIAPAQGVVAGDFNGDGHADVFLTQNSFAPVPAVGPWTGGVSQFLAGDGRGQFRAVPAIESGFVVPGDAKAAVVFDWNEDGWPDVLVSRNQAPALAWQNTGRAGGNAFEVRLRGPAGNPTGVGGSVTVELADGATQTGEIHAGGGYASQSAPGVFFGFPEQNPPRRLRVRWPDGSTYTQEFSAPPRGRVTLAPP